MRSVLPGATWQLLTCLKSAGSPTEGIEGKEKPLQ